VLALRGDGAAPPETQLAWARRFLQSMRSPDSGRFAFGGRLLLGVVDAPASLRNYYATALKTAKHLAEDEALAPGVRAFVTGQLGLPADLAIHALPAVGLEQRVAGEAEREGQLGPRRMRDREAFDALLARHKETGTAFDDAAIAIDDASVERVMARMSTMDFMNKVKAAHPRNQASLLDLLSRALELGLVERNGDEVRASDLRQPRWAVTEEVRAALLRCCAAARIDPLELALGTQPIVTPIRRRPTFDALPSVPLGQRSLAREEIVRMTRDKDPALFAVDDASLQGIVAHQRFGDRGLLGDSIDWHKGLMRAWDRALFLAAESDLLKGMAQFSPDYVMHLSRSRELWKDRGVLHELVRLLRRAGEKPLSIRVETGLAIHNRAFMAAWDHHDKVALDALAPVPTRGGAARVAADPAFDYWGPYLLAERWRSLYEYIDDPNSHRDKYFDPALRSPDVHHFLARMIEGGSTDAAARCAIWLRRGVRSRWSGDDHIAGLAHLARAAGVDARDVTLHLSGGRAVQLSAHPRYPRQRSVPEVEAVMGEALRALDGWARAPAAAKVEALERLVTGTAQEPGPEVDEVFAWALAAIRAGRLEPIDFDALSPPLQQRVLGALTADAHIGVATMLAGVFVSGEVGPKLEAALVELGYDAAQARAWCEVATLVRGLDPAEKERALGGLTREGGPDFWLLALRVRLTALPRLDAGALGALFDAHVALDPAGVAGALLDRALLAGEGSADAAVVFDVLKDRVSAGALSSASLAEAIGPRERRQLVLTRAEAVVGDAVKGVLDAGVTDVGALDALRTAMKAAAALIDPRELVPLVLGQLYRRDLARVIPLDVADRELGGVAAKELRDERGPLALGRGKRVSVAGIEIQANEDPRKDVRAVPRADAADLVMTATTERNLRRIAMEWRRGRPVLLEGPTSAGKTSAVRHLAHVTGSPYRRINLSYHTDVDDLIGRYVGGEVRFGKADLDKKSEAALSALAEEYGLDEGLSRAEQVRQLLDVQHRSRWVDGPIVKAMRKGEVLLLDEVNLARPAVLERLNSLFDDDGNIVLTEHRNEVVQKHDNFRIFATMNPASYAGRAPLSEAMRSRWTSLYTQGLDQADLTKILKTRFGATIPAVELAKLIASHDALARAADEGKIGRASGGVAFSLRNLFRVCERFERYRGGELSDAALMRRETEEIYGGGLFDPEDLEAVDDLLSVAMPYEGPGFYDKLELHEDEDTISIGDVTVRKLDTGSALVPPESARLVLTDRTKQVLYRLAKALDCGENVALIGERASGKTAIAKLYAHLVGQPYLRQMISASTDTMQLVGGYDERGWKDGLLLNAGRPDGAPGLLLLDELNLGGSALLERLNPVLDDERKVVLAEKEGEEVRLHPDFRFVAAMNPPTRSYGGRQKLSKALQNRLTQIYVPDLDKADEQKEILGALAERRGVPVVAAHALVDMHQWAVESYADGTLGKGLREAERPVLSVRQLLNALDSMADLIAEHGVPGAFLLAVENYYAATSYTADCEAIMAKAKEVVA
jgi:MoxR-like ATPase